MGGLGELMGAGMSAEKAAGKVLTVSCDGDERSKHANPGERERRRSLQFHGLNYVGVSSEDR